MDNQDKLFEKIKEASKNAEFQGFDAMEKVWSRVEEKLDKKEDKKAISLWKKIAIAASFLLLLSIGFQFLNSDKTVNSETQEVVFDQKENNQKPAFDQPKETIPADSGIISYKEGAKIIEHHIQNSGGFAAQEAAPAADMVLTPPAPTVAADSIITHSAAKGYFEDENDKNMLSYKDKAASDYNSAKEAARVAYAERSSAKAKKSSPLVILNGTAMAHSNEVKRDKMMQEELPNLNPENVESLVVLDEPLYIIDGIYYSENDLFGDNPTSPYAPLNQQEIKTITILQDLEATSKYGEKGKKGVVIITTKTGKPIPKK
ncbi:hypothetical protein [Flavobacterium foetidum]|uniref:hypothetical protein n=1 Tax=Flavobacterium foetidum TaxID=2026681 RepID=UPI0010752584|nr:hypothetical protein [Flavobacterium foetidum]KAF2517368.1 hypothetical protein E0W73_04515 [Flavobacterium foetidum]